MSDTIPRDPGSAKDKQQDEGETLKARAARLLAAEFRMQGNEIRCPSKPEQCPACGEGPVADVCYGLIDPTPRVRRDIDAGKIVLGGCIVSPDSAVWMCTHCHVWIHRSEDAPKPEPRDIVADFLDSRGEE